MGRVHSSTKFVCVSQQAAPTGKHEAQSREPVNKVKKLSVV
jgi:hypothetical protein